ncbi:MAG: DUF2750 domain-containing protein [Hyphomicrobiaceae bacterium]|nr:DUF2750 domain-containing protein [Hyphomicrobiaceae bacterium]
MAHAPRPPELTRRDRFVRRVVAARRVYAVAGESGLARVPSRALPGREVTLLWSAREEAQRWASLVAVNPRVKDLPLSEALGDLLPALTRAGRLIGTDWTSDEIEPEAEPEAVADALRVQTVETFVSRCATAGRVWLLEDSAGPALLVAAARPGQLVLPCWADRDSTEMRIEGPWVDMLATDVPLANFLDVTLPWLAERDWHVCPDHMSGAGGLELEPAEITARFRRARSAA